MPGERQFIDSNIWLYAFIDDKSHKHRQAQRILGKTNPFLLSSQVVSEVCVNMLKKAGKDESFIQELIAAFYDRYEVVPIAGRTLLKASELRTQYSLSYWDSLICAAALETRCDVLLTEDMQHGLIIDKRLELVNPFL